MTFLDQLREGRIGRVPVWAVGVGLAGLIIVFVVIRNRMRGNAQGDDAPQVTGTEEESVEGIPTGSFSDQLSGRFPASNLGTVPPALSRPVTNAQWLTIAFDYLVGLGKIPGVVQRALQDYLAGKSLSAEQQQLIDIALANSAVSLPPEGVRLPDNNPQNPPTNTIPQYVSVPINYNLYTWVNELKQGYGSGVPDFFGLFGRFKGDPTALNPAHRGYMYWEGSPGNLYPVFHSGTPQVRLR
jgi:hypothetical protein